MHKHVLGAVRWRLSQANPVATFQMPTRTSARACADGERVNSTSATRVNSRTDAVRLCAKAIMIANALEKIAKLVVAGSLEATRIGTRGGAVWLHGTVLQRMLRLCACARLGASARLTAVVAAARLLVPCADTVADAWTASDEVSRGIWLKDVPAAAAAATRLLMSRADTVANAWAASRVPIVSCWPRVGLRCALWARPRLHWQQKKVVRIAHETTPNWLVVIMRSSWRRSWAWGLVQGLVSHRVEDLDLEEGREGVCVNRVARCGWVGRNAAVAHPTRRRMEPFRLPARRQPHKAALVVPRARPAVASSATSLPTPTTRGKLRGPGHRKHRSWLRPFILKRQELHEE